MALVALGVTGGIGAYKAIEVCRGLQKQGHDVVAVMTRSAARFVSRYDVRIVEQARLDNLGRPETRSRLRLLAELGRDARRCRRNHRGFTDL